MESNAQLKNKPPSAADFQALVQIWIQQKGPEGISQLADAFQVSPSVVSRWSTGFSVPMDFMRTTIVEWLTSNVQ